VRDAQRPDHVTLNTLIGYLKHGRFVIPDFQREFEWKPWDINELMRSIFQDYYIGSLLLWKGKRESYDALSCEIIYGYKGTSEHHTWEYSEAKPDYIVLDGQQRLTALYYTFVAPDVALPNRAKRAFYFIDVSRFMAEESDEAFQYEWASQRVDALMADRNSQFEKHLFPLSTLGGGTYDLPNWLQAYKEYWEDRVSEAEAAGDEIGAERSRLHEADAEKFGEYITDVAEQYQIAFIELDKDLAVDKVCDIFTQINSKGVRLDVFDLINALLKPKGLQLKHMWRGAKKRLDFVESTKLNVYILQTMSILRQYYCSPKYLYYLLPGQEKQVREEGGALRNEILVPDTETFERLWDRAVDALEEAIHLLRDPREYGAIKSTYLPYVSILPIFSALHAHIAELPAGEQLEARRKVRHWYWASVFMNRYSGSVESTSARDFLDVTDWIRAPVAEPAAIGELRSGFRNVDLRKETKSGSSVYNGVFNLLILRGARDWRTGSTPMHGALDDHHIVPASWGKKHLDGDAIHTILNRTPLSAETNRVVINDRLPNEYLPELLSGSDEEAVRSIMSSHLISAAALEILLRNPFSTADFEAFIEERKRAIQEAIESLLIKQRLDLEPRIQELDASLEGIELALRSLLVKELEDEIGALPEHVAHPIRERLRAAARKNPSLDPEQYRRLSKALEFSDLRELEQAIVSKALWDRFQLIFESKGTLAQRFDQLANLRNSIRHSRAVDEITRKDGEASIAWFEQVLKR